MHHGIHGLSLFTVGLHENVTSFMLENASDDVLMITVRIIANGSPGHYFFFIVLKTSCFARSCYNYFICPFLFTCVILLLSFLCHRCVVSRLDVGTFYKGNERFQCELLPSNNTANNTVDDVREAVAARALQVFTKKRN